MEKKTGLYAVVLRAVKKLKDEDLPKIIEGHIFIIININFIFLRSFYLFIGIYYDISESFNYFNQISTIQFSIQAWSKKEILKMRGLGEGNTITFLFFIFLTCSHKRKMMEKEFKLVTSLHKT